MKRLFSFLLMVISVVTLYSQTVTTIPEELTDGTWTASGGSIFSPINGIGDYVVELDKPASISGNWYVYKVEVATAPGSGLEWAIIDQVLPPSAMMTWMEYYDMMDFSIDAPFSGMGETWPLADALSGNILFGDLSSTTTEGSYEVQTLSFAQTNSAIPSGTATLHVHMNDAGNLAPIINGADTGIAGSENTYLLDFFAGQTPDPSGNMMVRLVVSDAPGGTPVVTASQTFDIDEDATNSTNVNGGVVDLTVAPFDRATYSANETWSITAGNGDGIFAISNSGQIYVTDNTNLNYETTDTYNLTVQVTYSGGDLNGRTDTETVTVTVNDSNDAPYISPALTNSSTGIGSTLTLDVNGNENDPDATDNDAQLTWSFVITNNNVDGDMPWPAGGTITETGAGTDIFEFNPNDGSYSGKIEVTATLSDDGGLTAQQTGLILDWNTNTAPVMATITTPSSVNEDNDIILTLTDADKSDGEDADGDLYWGVTGFDNGSVAFTNNTPVISGNTIVTFTPDADFFGTDQVTLVLYDSNGGQDTQTLDLTWDPVNDEPSFTVGSNQTANEDSGAKTVHSFITNIDKGDNSTYGVEQAVQTVSFNVSNNNNALFSSQPAISSTGILTYTPAANANGSTTVDVYMTDNGGTANGGDDTSSTEQFTITVNPQNDPPVNTAIPTISGTGAVGTDLTVSSDGTWNDDLDGNPAPASFEYQWQFATDMAFTTPIDIFGANASSYTVQPADAGKYLRVKVTATDSGTPGTASATAFSTGILAMSGTPTGGDDSVTFDEGNTYTFAETDFTYSDPNSDPFGGIRITAVETAGDLEYGGVDVTANTDYNDVTQLVFTPASPTANGIPYASFSFKVKDNTGAYSTGTYTMTINVTPVDAAPVLAGIPDQNINEGDSFVAFDLDDYLTEIDGDNIIYSYSGNTELTVNINSTTHVATVSIPNPDWDGSETITFRATDDTVAGLFDEDSAVFTVTGTPDAPVITGQVTVETPEETPVTITLNDLIVDDPDSTYPDDFTLTVYAGSNYTVSGNEITPVLDFNGTLTVPVSVNDGSLDSDIYSMSVTVTPVNDAPVITGQFDPNFSTPEETPVTIELGDLLVTDVDNTYPTGFSLTVGTGSNYSVSGNEITPDLDFNGTLTVPVTVNDGSDDSNTFNMSVTVTPVNDAPVIDSQVSVPAIDEEGNYTVTLADLNVTDVDNTYPTGFTLQVNDGPNYSVSGDVVTPDADYNGTLNVGVQVNDGELFSNTFSFEITVNPLNDAPVITGQNSVVTNEEVPVIISLDDLLVTDPDNTYPADFTLTVGTGSNYSVSGAEVTPDTDFFGNLTVPVYVNDGNDDSNTFDLTVTVNNVNDAPVIVSQLNPLTTQEDMPITVELSDLEVTDVDNTYPTGFSLELFAGANYTVAGTTVTPDENYSGTLSVDAQVNDGESINNLSNIITLTIDVTAENDAPVITGQNPVSILEEETYNIELTDLIVDDPDNTYPTGFSLIVYAGTNYSVSGTEITPDADFFGNLSVPVSIDDGVTETASNIYNMTITVQNVNDAPVVTSTPVETATEGQLYSYTFVATDVDPDVLTYSAPVLPNWLSFAPATGLLTGTPTALNIGNNSVVLRVSDGTVEVDQPFNIVVTPENTAPMAYDKSVSVNEDMSVMFTLDGSDAQDDLSELTFEIVDMPTNYQIFNLTGRSVNYQPITNYNGADSFTYRVMDTDGLYSTPATVSITVNPVNDKPLAQSFTANAGGVSTFIIDLADYVSDIETIDGNLSVTYPLKASLGTEGVFGGTLTHVVGTQYQYTMNTNTFAEDYIPYYVTDEGGLSSSPTQLISVTGLPADRSVPKSTIVAVPRVYDINGNTMIDVEFLGLDVQSPFEALTVNIDNSGLSLVSLVSGPTLESQNGMITSYSATYQAGISAGTEIIPFTVSDGVNIETGQITLNVTAVAQAPQITSYDATWSLTEDQVGGTTTVMFEDVDTPAENLTWSVTATPSVAGLGFNVTDGGAGEKVIEAVLPANWNGSTSLNIKVTDNTMLSHEVTQVLEVAPVNDAPYFVSTPITSAMEGVLYSYKAVAMDADGDILTYSATTLPAWLNFNANTQILSATPTLAEVGTHNVVLEVTDSQVGTTPDTQTFAITVVPSGYVNVAPVANNDTYNTDEDVTLNVAANGVMGNDTDDNYPSSTLTAELLTSTSNGALTFRADGSFDYVPFANFFGADTFTYRVSDGSANSNTATVTINVASVNDAPMVTLALGPLNFDEDFLPIAYDLNSHFSDVEGDAISYSLENSNINEVEVTLSNAPTNNVILFESILNWNGTSSVTVRATDINGDFYDYVFDVVVAPVNDAPTLVANMPNVTEAEDFTGFTIDLDTYFNDIDDTLNYGVTNTDTEVTCSITGNILTVESVENYFGNTSITVTATDGVNPAISDSFNLTVTPVNDAPVVSTPINDINVDEDFAQIQIALNNHFTEVDGESMSYGVTYNDTEVACSVVGNVLNIDSELNWNGTTTITVTATDATSNSTDKTFDIVVAPVNDTPVLTLPAEFTFEEDASQTYDFTPYVSDVDNVLGDLNLTWSGNSIINVDQLGWDITFSSTQQYWNGTETLTFQLTDGDITVSETVDVTATPVNNGPTITLPDSFTYGEDGELVIDFTGYITDIEPDTHTLSVSGNTGVTVDITGLTVTFGTTPDWNGTETLTFTVDDNASDATASDVVDIIVFPVNDEPIAMPIADITETEDFDEFTIDLSTYFMDVDGDVLVYTIAQNNTDEVVCSIDGSILTVTAVPNWNGTSAITVRANDMMSADSDTKKFISKESKSFVDNSFDVIVTPVNDAPTIDLPATFTFTEGESLEEDFSQYIEDVDGDMLTLTVSGNTNIQVGISGLMVTMTSPAWNGTEALTFTVSDGVTDVLVSDNTVVTVEPAVQPLEFDLPATFTFAEDGQLIEDFTNYISNATSPVITVSGMQHLSVTIVGTSVTFTADENWNGTESVYFTVTDGSQSVGDMVNVTVTPVADDPVVTMPIADITVQEDFGTTVINLSEHFTDPDGDDLTYSVVTNNTSEVVCSISGAILTITSVDNWNGTSAVVVSADDGTSADRMVSKAARAEVYESFSVIVLPLNDPPVVSTPIDDMTKDEEFETFTIDLSNHFSDPEGDDLTYSLTTHNPQHVLASISGNVLEISSVANWNGSTSITVQASDGIRRDTKAVVSDTFTITVTPVNDAPVIVAWVPEDLDPTYTTGYRQFAVSVEDDDTPANDLVYTWTVNEVTQASTSEEMNYEFTTNGMHDVKVVVSDGEFEDMKEWVVNIQIYAPAIVTQAPVNNNVSVLVNTEQTFEITAEDEDETAVLTYMWKLDGVVQESVEPTFTHEFTQLGDFVVEAIVSDGVFEDSFTWDVKVGETGITDPSLPEATELYGNYPNPFNPETTISFGLAKTSNVKITVYNRMGAKIATVLNGVKEAGFYKVRWDGTSDRGMGVSAGIYYYRMEADGMVSTKRAILVK